MTLCTFYYSKDVPSNVITGLSIYECHFNLSNKNRRTFLNSKKKIVFHAYVHIFGREESWHAAFHKSCILRDNLYLNISFKLKCFSIFISNTWRGERVLRFRYFSSRCCWSLFVTDVGNLRHLTFEFYVFRKYYWDVDDPKQN